MPAKWAPVIVGGGVLLLFLMAIVSGVAYVLVNFGVS